MKFSLSGIALAAMLLALPTAVVLAQEQAPAAGPQMTASFVITPDGGEAADKIIATLRQVKGVTNVAGLSPENKVAVVAHVPAQVSVHQIAQAIADMPTAAGRPYLASLLVRVVNLSEPATRDKAVAALRSVPGVASAGPMDANAGLLAIQFAPLAPGDRTGGPKGATQEQVMKGLTTAEIEVTPEVAPAAATRKP